MSCTNVLYDRMYLEKMYLRVRPTHAKIKFVPKFYCSIKFNRKQLFQIWVKRTDGNDFPLMHLFYARRAKDAWKPSH